MVSNGENGGIKSYHSLVQFKIILTKSYQNLVQNGCTLKWYLLPLESR